MSLRPTDIDVIVGATTEVHITVEAIVELERVVEVVVDWDAMLCVNELRVEILV